MLILHFGRLTMKKKLEQAAVENKNMPFEESIPIKTRQISILLVLQSTLALRTPRYNGHPDETDSS